MKTKKIVAVSSALMIGTTTALTGFPAVVLAQENMQEAVTSEQEEKYTKVSVKNPVADGEELKGKTTGVLSMRLTVMSQQCGIHSGARMDRKKCRIGSVTVWIR